MPTHRITRRGYLRFAAAGAAVALLSACGGSQAVTTTVSATRTVGSTSAGPAVTAVSSSASKAAATSAATTSAGLQAVPNKGSFPEVRIWFHWGGKTHDTVQQLINTYNTTQGQQDKVYVRIETFDSGKAQEKMTAAKLGGESPDIYSTSLSPKTLVANGFVDPLPQDEAGYVKDNYIAGALGLVNLQGKTWGYPTEFQPPAYLYRTSWFREMGISKPPATTDDEFEYAAKLTQKKGTTPTRFGFGFYSEGYPLTSHLPTLIARFGGQMFSFDGDHPTAIDVASPQAIDAVGWWKKLVQQGYTNVNVMPYVQSWKQSKSATTEIEVWFTLINLRDAGLRDIYDDLDGVPLPPSPGQKPITYAGGWKLAPAAGSKHADARWPFLRWMMHKPAMPFSRFIVETVGAAPSPTNYPTPIPGWSTAMNKTYMTAAQQSQTPPTLNVQGMGEINTQLAATLKDIINGKTQLETSLKDLNSRLNAILKRTDPA